MASRPTSRTSPDTGGASLEVHLLGLVDFDSALALQERLIYEISGSNSSQGALLICEHPPLITMGREASAAHLLVDERELAAREIDVRWIGRGGGAFIHAPGQLAVYPLLPLDRLGIGVSEFRARLERSLVDACRDVRAPARRRLAEPGLWSRGGHLAYFGAAVKSWVSCHGAFLNVQIDPAFLSLLATNSTGVKSTSLQAQLVRRLPMGSVREAVIRHVATRFGYDRFHVYTGHPLLRRTTRRICQRA